MLLREKKEMSVMGPGGQVEGRWKVGGRVSRTHTLPYSGRRLDSPQFRDGRSSRAAASRRRQGRRWRPGVGVSEEFFNVGGKVWKGAHVEGCLACTLRGSGGDEASDGGDDTKFELHRGGSAGLVLCVGETI